MFVVSIQHRFFCLWLYIHNERLGFGVWQVLILGKRCSIQLRNLLDVYLIMKLAAQVLC